MQSEPGSRGLLWAWILAGAALRLLRVVTRWDELTLAYAMSVHKSQGSEYPVVVLPLLTQHYMLLQRNLLYTAITRAKRMVVIVGTRKAMAMAVKNDRIAARWTALQQRLDGPEFG